MDLWGKLLKQAYSFATNSNDPSTQNGALVVAINGTHSNADTPYRVLAGDYNRFPKGVTETPERWNDRALKYKLVQHAERSALETARRLNGLAHLDGHTMICPWAACTDCAKSIIDSGLTRLVTHKQAAERSPPSSSWLPDIEVANMMLREAGIEIICYDGPVGALPVRHSGQVWTP